MGLWKEISKEISHLKLNNIFLLEMVVGYAWCCDDPLCESCPALYAMETLRC